MLWNRYIIPLLLFVPLAIIQLVIIPLISISGAVPNLVLILIVYFTLLNGQAYGTVLGFTLGFFLDLISGGLLGAFMFSFTISAFIAGYFYGENKIEINTGSYFFLLILFIAGVINSFIYSAVSNSNTNVSVVLLFVEEGLIPGVYTTLFGLPLIVFSSKKGF